MEQEKVVKLEERIRAEAESGKMPCRKAFAIAEELDLPKIEVGKKCNDMDVKIESCQLGCF